MTTTTADKKIKGTSEAWESGELGRDEKYVRRSTADVELQIEDTLDLQMISLRLQRELIKELKFIAKYHGVGYQPLMRDVLGRWARSEMGAIAKQLQEKKENEAATAHLRRKRA